MIWLLLQITLDKEHSITRNHGVLACPISGCTFSGQDDHALGHHMGTAHSISSVSCHILEGDQASDSPKKAVQGGVKCSSIKASSSSSSPYPSRHLSGNTVSGTSTLSITSDSGKNDASQGQATQISHNDSCPLQVGPSASSSHMEEAQPIHALDGTQCYLISDKFLTSHSLQIHNYFKTLHCIACGVAQPPHSMPGHIHHHHHKSLSKAEINDLAIAAQKHGVRDGTDVSNPSPGGPPVEGLALHPGGYACKACNICKLTYRTFENH